MNVVKRSSEGSVVRPFLGFLKHCPRLFLGVAPCMDKQAAGRKLREGRLHVFRWDCDMQVLAFALDPFQYRHVVNRAWLAGARQHLNGIQLPYLAQRVDMGEIPFTVEVMNRMVQIAALFINGRQKDGGKVARGNVVGKIAVRGVAFSG